MITGAYEKAKKYIEAHSNISREEKELTQGPCITISRETGAGADRVSEILCEKLQRITKTDKARWTVFGKNLIEKIIEDHKFPNQIANFLEEGKRSDIDTYVSELMGLQPSSWVLIHKTAQTIMQLASIGNVIVVGRGANIVTSRLPYSLHVRLTSPVEDRIKHIQELFNLNYKEAVEHIKKDEEHRKSYLRRHYGKDIDDPHLYHIVMNTHLLSYEEAAEVIKNLAESKFPKFFRS